MAEPGKSNKNNNNNKMFDHYEMYPIKSYGPRDAYMSVNWYFLNPPRIE